MAEDLMSKKIASLAKKFKLDLKNPDLFRNAFVHRSYLNENPKFDLENNERLEFLGDAVLELAATKYLYNKYKMPEGELTTLRSAIVRGKNLSETGKDLGIEDCIYLSYGEKHGSEKAKSLIIANCVEAIIGAIYLDLGFEEAEKFIAKNILSSINKIINEKSYIDSKSEFQEKIQEKLKLTPNYKVLKESGPDHNKEFTSGVFVKNQLIAEGKGSSKSIAEDHAARVALTHIDEIA